MSEGGEGPPRKPPRRSIALLDQAITKRDLFNPERSVVLPPGALRARPSTSLPVAASSRASRGIGEDETVVSSLARTDRPTGGRAAPPRPREPSSDEEQGDEKRVKLHLTLSPPSPPTNIRAGEGAPAGVTRRPVVHLQQPASPSPPSCVTGRPSLEEAAGPSGYYHQYLPQGRTQDRDMDATSYVGLDPVASEGGGESPSSPTARGLAASYAAVLAAPRRHSTSSCEMEFTAPVDQSPPSLGKCPSPHSSPASRTPPLPQPPPQTKAYPPIVVECLPNWTEHFTTLRRTLGHAPHARPLGKGVRFIPRSADEYRAIQRHLVDAMAENPAISWYSYSTPAELPTKVAIRGLPADTPTDKIQAALIALDFPVRYVRQIKGAQGRQGCLFHAQLDRLPVEDLARLYRISELLFMPGVKVEAWRGARLSGRVAQCHRCQAFGHASANCHRPQRCVRCGGQHAASNCPKGRTENPSCANCGREHTANDRRCPVYRREARKRGLQAPAPAPQVVTAVGRVAPPLSRAESPVRETGGRAGAPPRPTAVPTLAPEANGPTQRGSAPKRRRHRGGRKNRKPVASSTILPAPIPAPRRVEPTLAPTPILESTPTLQEIPEGIPTTALPQRDPLTRRPRLAAQPSPPATDAGPSTVGSDRDPINLLIGALVHLFTAIVAGDDIREAAVRGLAFLRGDLNV